MLPYIELPSVQLGSLTIHPFGIFVALSIIVSVWYSFYIAEKKYKAGRVLLDMAPCFLLLGFISAHLASIFFYYPSAVKIKEWKSLIDITTGLSSFGGLFGGAFGAFLFIKIRNLPLLPWLDILARAFSLSYIFGRAGCSLAHDHPGLPTDFILAIRYPPRDGFLAGPRHDLGFYELLLWPIIFFALHTLGNKKQPDGLIISLLIIIYSPIRFSLDFLRVNDMTYWGLTFAQWSSLFIFPVGLLLFLNVRKKPTFQKDIGVSRIKKSPEKI